MRPIMLAITMAACIREPRPVWDDRAPESFLVWDDQRVVDCEGTEYARYSVEWWQRQTCSGAIRCASPHEEWNAYPSYEMPLGVMADMAGDHDAAAYWEPELERVWIWLRDPGTIDVEFRLTVHEMGHALGLAHDPGSMSVMSHPLDMTRPALLDHEDETAIEQRWCR